MIMRRLAKHPRYDDDFEYMPRRLVLAVADRIEDLRRMRAVSYDERWEAPGMCFDCTRFEWGGLEYMLAWRLAGRKTLRLEMFGLRDGFFDRLRMRFGDDP